MSYRYLIPYDFDQWSLLIQNSSLLLLLQASIECWVLKVLIKIGQLVIYQLYPPLLAPEFQDLNSSSQLLQSDILILFRHASKFIVTPANEEGEASIGILNDFQDRFETGYVELHVFFWYFEANADFEYLESFLTVHSELKLLIVGAQLG